MTTTGATTTPLIQMRGIEKSFLGVTVLHGVDLDLHPGEVHAVVGENGAGKSTLMKILAGVYQPDAGTISIRGEQQNFHHPSQAQAAGVAIIYQEFNLLPYRTVAENVYVGREPVRRGLVDRRAMENATAELLEELGETSFSSRSIVGRLSVAQQQVVEIVKALSLNASILVMDEPTAALAEHEAELLAAMIRRLQDRGIGILYISHRLKEVFALSDRITVLKDGQLVATKRAGEVDSRGLVKLMVGRELDSYFPPRRQELGTGDVRLRVHDARSPKLHDIELELRAGEIVGVAGLQGSGRTSLARAIFGSDPFSEGEIELDARRIRIDSPRGAIRAGMGFITEDRKAEGLALAQSVRDNALLALRTLIPARRRRRDPDLKSVEELTTSTELRARSLEQEVRFLSGGNQQKVVLAKWLATRPKVIIFDEPTRGIDVGAKAGIHDLMRGLAEAGVAILMISSELPELIGMSDRILVMREGRIVGELPAASSEEDIMHLATEQEMEAAA
jgi:ABC-type sugar transport system ATPase subunit